MEKEEKGKAAELRSDKKPGEGGAYESKFEQRLKAIQNIVTKKSPVRDAQKDNEAAMQASPSLSIDSSVFHDNEAAEEAAEIERERRDSTRSKTIDIGMLSKERSSGNWKTKHSVSVDFSKTERFYTGYENGLSSDQVQLRNSQGFVNVTSKKKGKSYASIFLSNIFTFLNMLAFIVAGALIAVGTDAPNLFFVIIITINILIGIFQEIKAKRTVDKLKLLTAPSAIVIRDGQKVAIPITEVVLDDVMFLETGKQICADAVVIRGEMEVNESMLTGESESQKKALNSELYSGSYVTSGNCYARVNKVGAANYVETLTSYAKRYRKPKSELNNTIRLIIRIVSIFIVPISAIMLYNNITSGMEIGANIESVAAAIMGMIPAGMYLLTSTALVVSVIKLARKKTLVQDLYCIEMLARVDVLCLDKTGTITDGTMQVNELIEIKGGESEYSINDIIGSILSATEDNNQTSIALASRFGYSHQLKPTLIMPFSSSRKMSAVTFEGAGTYMLGAPEFVLREIGAKIQNTINDCASKGYRVLCLAHSPSDIVGNKLPAIRRPVCLIVIEDHIRPDAFDTIRWFKENNVKVKVISGDNPITVAEVSKRVGVENAEKFISLEGLSNQEVVEAANKFTVFGRVSPEQKLLIIKALKAKGRTVAMTGDGVNDILAMREADCSVSIASGAEAARNVSHLVLLDSSFTSMPDVVKEGRRVINNIQKASSLFLMKTLMSIVLSLIFLIIPTINKAIFTEYPYLNKNLLLLEFFVIALSSFVLALQGNTNIIKGKFLSNVLGRCVPGGIALVLSTMAVYVYCTVMPVPERALYETLLVISLSITGVMLLAKTCEPFDTVRSVLLVGVATLVIVSILFLPESLFGIQKATMNAENWMFVIAIAFGSYFVMSVLMKAMRSFGVLS